MSKRSRTTRPEMVIHRCSQCGHRLGRSACYVFVSPWQAPTQCCQHCPDTIEFCPRCRCRREPAKAIPSEGRTRRWCRWCEPHIMQTAREIEVQEIVNGLRTLEPTIEHFTTADRQPGACWKAMVLGVAWKSGDKIAATAAAAEQAARDDFARFITDEIAEITRH